MKCGVCGKTLYGPHTRCDKFLELENECRDARREIDYLKRNLEGTMNTVQQLTSILSELHLEVHRSPIEVEEKIVNECIKYSKEYVKDFLKDKLVEEWKKVSETTEW
jgi:hypothetical protein